MNKEQKDEVMKGFELICENKSIEEIKQFVEEILLPFAYHKGKADGFDIAKGIKRSYLL